MPAFGGMEGKTGMRKGEDSMEQTVRFEYFRGMEAEQYTFYRIPKMLFTAEYFKSLSCEAKVLYGLMLDRMNLSLKNRWFDEEDKVYIIFTVEEISELMNCGTQKAVKLMKELDSEQGIGLIEKKRLGLGKPNVIYVKNFMIQRQAQVEEMPEQPVDSQNSENHNSGVVKTTIQEFPESQFKNSENHNSRIVKTTNQEFPESQFRNSENHQSRMMKTTSQKWLKSQSNKTDINNTDFSNTESIYPKYNENTVRINGIEKMNTYREIVRENIGYGAFEQDSFFRMDEVDELVELITDVFILPDNGTVRIEGMEKPVPIVKSRFMKLNHEHIMYVLSCMQENTTKVNNIKGYLLTALYNAPTTIGSYYHAAVNHDLYGGGNL